MKKLRKGQTSVEYILITVVMVVVFVFLHKAMQWAVSQQFKQGGITILKMYKEDY